MSVKSEEFAEEGTPTYVTRFDGVRVPATDYHPVWLENLAEDVTLEGSAMNGVVQGAEAVRSIVTYIRTLYDTQEFNFAGPYGHNGFLEDYTAGSTASQFREECAEILEVPVQDALRDPASAVTARLVSPLGPSRSRTRSAAPNNCSRTSRRTTPVGTAVLSSLTSGRVSTLPPETSAPRGRETRSVLAASRCQHAPDCGWLPLRRELRVSGGAARTLGRGHGHVHRVAGLRPANVVSNRRVTLGVRVGGPHLLTVLEVGDSGDLGALQGVHIDVLRGAILRV
jgi:hypothetical protein